MSADRVERIRALVLWRRDDLGKMVSVTALLESLTVEGTALRPVPEEHEEGVRAFRRLTHQVRRRTVERVLEGL